MPRINYIPKRKSPLPVYEPPLDKPLHELNEDDEIALARRLCASRIPILVRSVRQARRMTQYDLAAKVGLSQAYISEIERGVRKGMTINTLARLARALGCCVGIDFINHAQALHQDADGEPVIPADLETLILRSKLEADKEKIRELEIRLARAEGPVYG